MDPETYQLNDIRELNTRREGWWDFIPRSANDPTVPSYQWQQTPARIPKPILTEEKRLEQKVQAAEGRGLNLGNLPGMSKTQKQATANALGKVGSAAVLGAMGYPNLAAQQAWSGVTGWVEGMMRDQAEKRLGIQKVSMPLSVNIANEADPYDYERLRIGKKRDRITKNPSVKHQHWKYIEEELDQQDPGLVDTWVPGSVHLLLWGGGHAPGTGETQRVGDFFAIQKIRQHIELYSRKDGDTWPAADTAVRIMLWYEFRPAEGGGNPNFAMFGFTRNPINKNTAICSDQSIFATLTQRRENRYLLLGDWKLNWKGNAGPTSTVFEWEKEFPAPLICIPNDGHGYWGAFYLEVSAEYLNQDPDGPYLQYDMHTHFWFTDSHSRKKHKRD